MSLEQVPLADLTQSCAEETQKFFRHEPNQTQFCFELFRRAFASQINDSDALLAIFKIYGPQVIRWVNAHTLFDQTGETAEYFGNLALGNLYFHLQGSRFEQFESLPGILAYLKRCVFTAVTQYVRDHPANTVAFPDGWDAPNSVDPLQDLRAEQLWQHICELLPDQYDRLLARCVFILDLKPRHIVALHPTIWRDEDTVRVARQRIRRILHRDRELREWAGVGEQKA